MKIAIDKLSWTALKISAMMVGGSNMKYVIEVQLPDGMWYVYSEGKNKGYFDTMSEAEMFALENFDGRETKVFPVQLPS